MAAGLKDDRVLADFSGLSFVYRIDHAPTFGDGEGNRLFTVDVLAGASGEDGGFSMPVIGGCDEHGVDVLQGKQFAVVLCYR